MVKALINVKIVAAALLLFISSVQAGPWIPVGDPWLRADIEYLADRGIITAPITTWPIMWSSIKQDMDRAFESKRFKELNEQEQNTLLRLKKTFRQHTATSGSLGIELASSPELIRGFSDSAREQSSVFVQRQQTSDHWAYNLNIDYVFDPFVPEGQVADEVRYDGSYITAIWENVAFGYGWVDKWWGPGWDTSLILSNNARPSPGLFVQRNRSEPFESDWLSWIGPWTIQGFATALDDNRFVTDANLLGLSVSFKPLDDLEIGLRRTAQWGGEGRPEDLESLLNLLIGRDNCGSDGIDECGAEDTNEPGNQLGAIDVRWRLPIEKPVSFYLQTMGEDEAGMLPSRRSLQTGFSFDVSLLDIPLHTFVEYNDSRTSHGRRYNLAYNHSLYRTGYRYLGRSIAATLDNDSESVTMGTMLQLENNDKLSVQLSRLRVNVDDQGLNNSISLNRADTLLLRTAYETISSYGKLSVGLHYYTDTIDSYDRQNDKYRLSFGWSLMY